MKDLEKRILEADEELNKGHLSKSIRILKKCLKDFPSDPLVLYNLGVVYYKAGRYLDSIYSLEEAVVAGAEEPDVYNQLGLSCDKNGDAEGAEAYYIKALEKDPEFPMAWNNLGVLNFLKKDYSKAFMCFEKSLVYDSNNPDTWFNYRDTCLELGFNEEAESADKKYREFLKH